jgi:cell division protein ZapA (FtsZ GTPase activity inhibitor)
LDQLITIEVLGQAFSFKTDSDVSVARAVADFVTQTVNQIASQCAHKAPTPDKRAILILTALHIASEYFDLKKQHQELLHDVNQRSENLLNALESEVAIDDLVTTTQM